jgi:hypothetical protein
MDPSSEGWNYGREYYPVILVEMATSTPFLHGKDGFTSPQEEGVLRIFSPQNFRRIRPGFNPQRPARYPRPSKRLEKF